MNALRWATRLVAAVGLGIDTYVHWHLAPSFDTLTGHGSPHVSQGQLFRVEAGLALVAMLLVLLLRRRSAAALAVLVAGGGVAAVLLYRYVDVGAFGPFPTMYEPFWYTEKTVSAVAEAVAALAALLYLFLPTGADQARDVLTGADSRARHSAVS